jgi:hypothetical protein
LAIHAWQLDGIWTRQNSQRNVHHLQILTSCWGRDFAGSWPADRKSVLCVMTRSLTSFNVCLTYRQIIAFSHNTRLRKSKPRLINSKAWLQEISKRKYKNMASVTNCSYKFHWAILLEKLVVAQLIKKRSVLHWIQWFTTMFATAHMGAILSQLNRLHSHICFKTCFNIILPGMPKSLKCISSD